MIYKKQTIGIWLFCAAILCLTSWGIPSTNLNSEISKNCKWEETAIFNKVQLKNIDLNSRKEIGSGHGNSQNIEKWILHLPGEKWSVSWKEKTKVYLRDNNGIWWRYKKKKIQGTVILIH